MVDWKVITNLRNFKPICLETNFENDTLSQTRSFPKHCLFTTAYIFGIYITTITNFSHQNVTVNFSVYIYSILRSFPWRSFWISTDSFLATSFFKENTNVPENTSIVPSQWCMVKGLLKYHIENSSDPN